MRRSRLLIFLGVLLLAAVAVAGCGSEETTVGVVTGTTFGEFAERFTEVDEVKYYRDDNLTLQELSTGRVSAVITDRLVGVIAIQEGNFSEIEPVGDFLYTETIAVAIRQEDAALRQAINEALAEIIADGTYADISEKYFGRDILEGIEYELTFPDEPAANDDSLQRVLDAGEITFAMSGGYPPFNYYNESNELTGFDVEIGEAVAERIGVAYTPVTTDWSGILEGLRSGRYDGIFGSMAITPERLEVVSFTDPYYYSGAQLFVKEGSWITGPQDLGYEE
ncbi:MAG: transporter substrate-binding domain-containing protein [Bacillota bacterium]|nr:transporter substrate-binding domain-containing protein [Bacillota bacterium]